MAMIEVREDDPWVVARWAFERLISAAGEEVADRPELVQQLRQASALDGLTLSLLNEADARALAAALLVGAARLAESERGKPDAMSQSFVAALTNLQMQLHDAYGIPNHQQAPESNGA